MERPIPFILTPDDPHAQSALLAYVSSMKRAGERDEAVREVRELAAQYGFFGKGEMPEQGEGLLLVEYTSMNYERLYALASDLGISGRSKMDKAELAQALTEHAGGKGIRKPNGEKDADQVHGTGSEEPR